MYPYKKQEISLKKIFGCIQLYDKVFFCSFVDTDSSIV